MLLKKLLVLKVHMQILQDRFHVQYAQQDLHVLQQQILLSHVLVVNIHTKWQLHALIVKLVMHAQILIRHLHFVHLDTIH